MTRDCATTSVGRSSHRDQLIRKPLPPGPLERLHLQSLLPTGPSGPSTSSGRGNKLRPREQAQAAGTSSGRGNKLRPTPLASASCPLVLDAPSGEIVERPYRSALVCRGQGHTRLRNCFETRPIGGLDGEGGGSRSIESDGVGAVGSDEPVMHLRWPTARGSRHAEIDGRRRSRACHIGDNLYQTSRTDLVQLRVRASLNKMRVRNLRRLIGRRGTVRR
jgi:hypothetical protein